MMMSLKATACSQLVPKFLRVFGVYLVRLETGLSEDVIVLIKTNGRELLL